MKQSILLPQFDLNAMTIFVKVVQAGSFIGAARALDMPKTTVSRKVAQLEETLGTRLLQRTTRQINLTEVGRVYFERCVRILGDLEEANLAVTALQTVPHGTLRISASTVFAISLLNHWLTEFLNQYEQVSAETIPGGTKWVFYQGSIEETVCISSRIRANDFLFLKHLVLQHGGIACLPSVLVMDEIRTGRLVHLLPSWSLTSREIYLVYPSDRHLSPKVTAFLDFVLAKVTPRPPWAITSGHPTLNTDK